MSDRELLRRAMPLLNFALDIPAKERDAQQLMNDIRARLAVETGTNVAPPPPFYYVTAQEQKILKKALLRSAAPATERGELVERLDRLFEGAGVCGHCGATTLSNHELETEVFDLFANYGSGDYIPTEQEKEVLHSGVAAIIKRAIQVGAAALSRDGEDAERLDFIEQLDYNDDVNIQLIQDWRVNGTRYATGLRAAIDAARAKVGK